MHILNASYFKDDLLIEGVMVSYNTTTTNEEIGTELSDFMKKYERIYLYRLLGVELCDKFVAYLEGKEDDNAVCFDKLKEMLCNCYGADLCPIANFVYFYYVRAKQLNVTSLGVTVASGENGVTDATPLLVKAWNDMVDMNEMILAWLNVNLPQAKTDVSMITPINALGV